MKIVEKYTGEKTYMFPNGAIATKDAVLNNTPAALIFTHIVETDEAGEIMWALQNLSAMKSIYGIDASTSEADSIAMIQEIINTEPEIDNTPSAEERIASALEFQTMMMLPDDE